MLDVTVAGVALAFGVASGLIAGWDFGTQYFAGYVVEKAGPSTTCSSSWCAPCSSRSAPR